VEHARSNGSLATDIISGLSAPQAGDPVRCTNSILRAWASISVGERAGNGVTPSRRRRLGGADRWCGTWGTCSGL